MLYKGVVTSVDRNLLKFSINGNVIVYMGIMIAKTDIKYLPFTSDVVSVSSEYFEVTGEVTNVYMHENSTFETEGKDDNFNREFLELIILYKFEFDDLLRIDYLHRKFEENFKSTVVDSKKLLFMVLWFVLPEFPNRLKFCKEAKLNFLSDCKSVLLETELESPLPYWSFGCQKVENVVGFLTHFKQFSSICIEDTDNRFPIIIGGENVNLFELIDVYVVLKNCYVFSEINNTKSQNRDKNFEYIYCSIIDIEVVTSVRETDYSYCTGECIFTELVLSHKSSILADQRENMTCWLDVRMKNFTEEENCFLRLNESFIKVSHMLKPGYSYFLYHRNELVECSEYEIARVKRQKMYKFNDRDNPKFVELNSNIESNDFLTLEEVLENLSKLTGLISFTGVITRRKFIKPQNFSRTSRKMKRFGFGFQGDKTHQLEFRNGSKFVVLFLNNWESFQMPLGLLPGMKVNVSKVWVQNGRYLKSTALTRIDVVAYEPKIHFRTVNVLRYNLDGLWGPNSYLGDGNLIPEGVLIWGPVYNFWIRSLSFTFSCDRCTCIRQFEEKCRVCNCNKPPIKQTTLTINTEDVKGSAQIIIKNEELVRVLLNLSPNEWEYLWKGLLQIGMYTWKSSEKYTCGAELLCHYVENINTAGKKCFDLMCRRLENDENPLPLWFCLDVCPFEPVNTAPLDDLRVNTFLSCKTTRKK